MLTVALAKYLLGTDLPVEIQASGPAAAWCPLPKLEGAGFGV